MKKILPLFAKRTLAFALALVLLLSLCPVLPLTAKAAVEDGWTIHNFNDYINVRQFYSPSGSLQYVDNAPFDWQVIFGHTNKSSLTFQATATVTDAKGAVIGTGETEERFTAGQAVFFEPSNIVDASGNAVLTTDLYGEFTITVEIDYIQSRSPLKLVPVATMVRTFSRVSSNPLIVEYISRSNPDKVFTVADPIDLVLNIKKNDGIAAAYNAAITVTNSAGTELLAARGVSLPSSTNIPLSLKDLLDIPSITNPGSYKVNLTLTDTSGNIALQESHDFAVSGLDGSVNASITSASGTNPTFGYDETPDMTLNLQKTDGVAESLIADITVTMSGSIKFQEQVTLNVPASGKFTYTPTFSGLPTDGDFLMTAVLSDDAGNARGSVSATFSRSDEIPMECTLANANSDSPGYIYYANDDFRLSLVIEHLPSASKYVTLKATGKVNGAAFEKTKQIRIPSNGKTTAYFYGTDLGLYGIFEDVTVSILNASGDLLWSTSDTYDFSRVLSTATPGAMPLLNVNTHFSDLGDKIDVITQQVDFSKIAGANMWRCAITWDAVEKEKGTVSLSRNDLKAAFDQTEAMGMKALVILAYNNNHTIDGTENGPKFYGEPNPNDSVWLNAYANYCYQVAKQIAQYYPDQVIGFEIWNEWNNSSMSKVPDAYRTGDQYAIVVKAASEKIRQVNDEYGTSFKVIGGATSGDGSQTNTPTGQFIQDMLATDGFLDAIDGISFHSYSNLERSNSYPRTFDFVSPEEFGFDWRLDQFIEFLNGANKEIWLTETGWSTNAVRQINPTNGHITYGVTEEKAAAYMVQLYTWALADGRIDRIFWYDLLNDLHDEDSQWYNNLTECNYGLLHSWKGSGSKPAYSAKQGYVAMCAMSSKLAGATYQGTVSWGSSGIEAYRFTAKDGTTMVVAWTTSDTTKTLRCSGSMTVTDMYGNTTKNLTSTTLSECPIYIVCDPDTLSVG